MNKTRTRVLSLLLTAVMILSLLPTTIFAAEAEGGAQTTSVIEIGTASELAALFDAANYADICNKDYVLTADINMNGQTYAPIGSFTDSAKAVPYMGTFDGNGYTISNLTISAEGHCAGIFAYVGTAGEIKNLNLDKITVTGTSCNNVGAVAGCLTGSVSRCYVSGSVSGNKNVGGIAGILHAGTIENCVADVDVQATERAGGLFGDANFNGRPSTADKEAGRTHAPNGSPLTTCLNTDPMNVVNNLITGSVSTTKSTAGGMLADFGNSLTSKLGTFSGNVVRSESISSGGSFGYVYGQWTESTARSVNSENVYWDSIPLNVPDDKVSTYRAHVNFTTRTAAQLRLQATYEALGWDFDRVWDWDSSNNIPVLRDVKIPLPEDLPPLYIDTAEELAAFLRTDFETNQKRQVYLDADIDMSAYENITPWGVSEAGAIAFKGTFDGQGHVIKNLTISAIKGKHHCTGLFGYIGERGKVTKLGLEDLLVDANDITYNVGGIAGCLTGSVTECYVTGKVYGKSFVGGITGILHGGTIENCWVDADIQAYRHGAGGLFGSTSYSVDAYKIPLADDYKAAYEAGGSRRAINVVNNLTLGKVTAGRTTAGGLLGKTDNATQGCPVKNLTGNVVWVDSVVAGKHFNEKNDDGTLFGPVFGNWSKAFSIEAEPYQNFYSKEIICTSATGQTANSLEATYGNFSSKTANQLGLQYTYEASAANGGLGWDFKDTWVWSTELGHPVLRGVTTPGTGIPLDQKTPLSLVTTFAGDPKTTRAFTWNTDPSITDTVVQYADNEALTGAVTVSGSYSELQVDEFGNTRNIHKVELDGLTPGTTYYYRAGDGTENWSAVHSFTTEAENSDSFTFFSITDTQAKTVKTYNDSNFANYENYKALLDNATSQYADGAFILHSGDVIVNDYLTHYDKLYELTQEHAASLPIMISPGNHDLAKDVATNKFNPDFVKSIDNFNSHYQFPDNGPSGSRQTVYSFDYGNAHFAILDSNRTVSYDEQIKWLKEDMDATNKDWKIVSIHVGPYSNSGKGNAKLIEAIEDAGVDVVFFGHNHTFLRSNQIKGETVDASKVENEFIAANGTIYYSSGCAGGSAGEGGEKAKPYFAVTTYEDPNSPTYGAVTVTKDTLTVKSYKYSNNNSTLIDEFVIKLPDASYTAPTAVDDLTYTGEPQALVTAGTATNGTMLYSLDGETYSVALPKATSAGTCTVYYKVIGNDGYSDVAPAFIEVTIAPKALDSSAVANIPAQYYTGSAVEPALTVMDGSSELTEGTDYTVAYSNNTAAGTATATVTFLGNYTGSATKTFTIVRRSSGNSSTTYLVEDKTDSSEYGTVGIRPKRAERGSIVFITVNPDTGYTLDKLLVTDKNGNELKLTSKDNGKYSFTMPASEVTVKATFKSSNSDLPFADVSKDDWFYSAVEHAYAQGIMVGTDSTTFAPSADLSRAMVAQILYKLDSDSYDDAPSAFLDTPSGSWFYTAVNWAAAEGVVAGYGNGLFGPMDSVTREQLAVILRSYAVSKGYPLFGSAKLDMYVDADETSFWAVDAMEWAAANNILRSNDGRLAPTAYASRADVAFAMMQFCENIVK